MKKKYIIILFSILLVYLLIGFTIKYRLKEIKRNESYTIGEVLKIYYGRGDRTVDYKYSINNEVFFMTSSEFTQNINQVGKKYFVIVNKNNLQQAYILDCCPYDESKHLVPSEGLHKIPDAELQKKADEAFEEIFNSPLGRLLPPY
ncbi:MAG: hypothetical protein ACOVQR_12005 [Flavobacterium sp.]|jgi:hypothetical protein|uniref:hypothetical protein n=1 Tax=Flavobacterium sp. TaxID=239 RepID=UPI003BA51467